MNKLTIGIDLDGVVFRTLDRVLERYNLLHGTKYVSDDIKDWNTHEWIGGDQSVYEFFNDPQTFIDLPMHDHVQDVLYRLDKRHEVYLVTDTHYRCLETRMNELFRLFPTEKYGFMKERKIFVGKFKELLMLDVLLDDKPTNIEYFKDKGFGTPIIYDWLLNRHVKDVIRIYGWQDFESEIKKIEAGL